MGNIYTGSNSGKAGLNVKKTDNTVDVFGVSQIQLGNNMTLANNGNGSVTVNSTGGGGGGSVDSVSFGSTGFLPNSATTGIITMTGTLNVGSGGTGATDAATARTNLGAGTMVFLPLRAIREEIETLLIAIPSPYWVEQVFPPSLPPQIPSLSI